LHVYAGRKFGVKHDLDEYGADVHGVRQMIIYGLKGMGSYARHARLCGEWDYSIGTFASEVTVFYNHKTAVTGLYTVHQPLGHH